MIAPVLLLPFVENAFKHGISQSRDKVWLKIHLEISYRSINFHIENSKPWTPLKDSIPGGIELENLTRRLEILYKDRYSLKIHDKEDIYSVTPEPYTEGCKMNIKCLLVDDEPLALDALESLIRKIPELDIIDKCQNAVEALQMIHHKKIDLLLLDIQMPELTGIEMLKSLAHPPKGHFHHRIQGICCRSF